MCIIKSSSRINKCQFHKKWLIILAPGPWSVTVKDDLNQLMWCKKNWIKNITKALAVHILGWRTEMRGIKGRNVEGGGGGIWKYNKRWKKDNRGMLKIITKGVCLRNKNIHLTLCIP